MDSRLDEEMQDLTPFLDPRPKARWVTPSTPANNPNTPWANRSRRFQAVTGACMALRAQDFAEQQGFDPIYINGQEDIDLCLRLNGRYKRAACWVAAGSVVIHHESNPPTVFSMLHTTVAALCAAGQGG